MNSFTQKQTYFSEVNVEKNKRKTSFLNRAIAKLTFIIIKKDKITAQAQLCSITVANMHHFYPLLQAMNKKLALATVIIGLESEA